MEVGGHLPAREHRDVVWEEDIQTVDELSGVSDRLRIEVCVEVTGIDAGVGTPAPYQ